MGTIKRTFANNLTGAGKLDATALDSNLPAANIANSSVTNVSALSPSLGQAISSVASDPPSPSLGDIWYNSTTGKLKNYGFGVAAWASGGSMGTGVSLSYGTGTQTATLSVGGYSTTYESVTQEYDGSSWANSTAYPGARYGIGTSGTQTSAVCWIGRLTGTPGPGSPAETNEYNGSTWTSSNNFPTAGSGTTGFGTQTATIATIPVSDTTCSYDGTSWTALGAPSNKNTSTLDGLGSLGTSTAGLIFGGRMSPGPVNTANSEEWDGSAWTAGGSLPAAIVFMNGFGTQTSSIGFGGDAPPGEAARADAYSYDGSAWSTDASLGTAVTRMGASVTSPSTAGISFGGIGPAGGGTGRTATEEYSGAAATVKTVTTS